MVRTSVPSTNRLMFRPFFAWFALKLLALFGAAGGCAVLALRSHNNRWLLGSVLVIVIALLVVCHYKAQAIIIHGFTLVCRRGMLKVRENNFPLWRVDIQIEQNLLGRSMDYGTVCLHVGDEIFMVYQVASIRKLRAVVISRQAQMMMVMVRRDIAMG
jgi:hypothetical protein